MKNCVEMMFKCVIPCSAQSMFQWFCQEGSVVSSAGFSVAPWLSVVMFCPQNGCQNTEYFVCVFSLDQTVKLASFVCAGGRQGTIPET